MHWLKGERVFRAAELLEARSMPLADVREASGFGSAETLRREFRKMMGVAPAKCPERMGAS